MKRTIISAALGLLLMGTLMPTLAACTARALAADDLMSGVQAQESASSDATLDPAGTEALTTFSVRLFQQSATEGNMLVSPLSAAYALGMTANGAEGETLAQMEEAFGLPLPELNDYLHTYAQTMPSGEEAQLNLANSLWFKDGLTIEQSFLQTNADIYGAGAFQAPFDASTKDDINQWVRDNTRGMIDGVVDEIPTDALLYLVNTVAFDATWSEPYENNQVRQATFTTEEGTSQPATMLQSNEGLYLEDDNAIGFVKPYANNHYQFVALLPDEGVSIADYVAGLDGARFLDLIANAQYDTVDAELPKFESTFDLDIADALKNLGIQDAFSGKAANFSGIASTADLNDENLYISRVLHKTFVTVDERGTKAAAVSAVEAAATSAAPSDPPKPKVVHLDRPFVYAIIDSETHLPLFLGVVSSLV